MTKQEMAAELALRLAIPRTRAAQALDEVVSIIRGEVKSKGECRVTALGKFSLRRRVPREGKSGLTGQEFHVPARNGIHFMPSADFKRAVNQE